MPRHESTPAPAAAAGQHGVGQLGVGQHGAGPRWDAIIVAGGRAKRLGGIDKTALIWHGRSLLDGVVAAASGAERVCVVGSEADLPAAVLRAVERPRWGGPAAAIVAGLEALAGDAGAHAEPGAAARSDADAGSGAPAGSETESEWILVLAGDLVRPDAAVALLLAEFHRLTTPTVDGLISVDSAGRRQPLLAIYRRAALVSSALLRPADNLSVMSLIGGLTLVELPLPDAMGDDVDTADDAARLGIVLPPAAPRPESAQPER